MRKSVILVAAVALSVVTVPSMVSQAQAAKHHPRHATRVVQREHAPAPAPAKDPLCNNSYQKGNMGWMEHYHCYGH
jgi:hypothetical protein